MGLDDLAVRQLERPRPPDLEDFVGVAQVRCRIFEGAAQRCERGSLLVDDRGHSRIERQPAQVFGPGYTYPGEVALERLSEGRAGLVE